MPPLVLGLFAAVEDCRERSGQHYWCCMADVAIWRVNIPGAYVGRLSLSDGSLMMGQHHWYIAGPMSFMTGQHHWYIAGPMSLYDGSTSLVRDVAWQISLMTGQHHGTSLVRCPLWRANITGTSLGRCPFMTGQQHWYVAWLISLMTGQYHWYMTGPMSLMIVPHHWADVPLWWVNITGTSLGRCPFMMGQHHSWVAGNLCLHERSLMIGQHCWAFKACAHPENVPSWIGYITTLSGLFTVFHAAQV